MKVYHDPLTDHLKINENHELKYLIINGPFPFSSLKNLLCCFKKLFHLTIKNLYSYNEDHELGTPEIVTNLKRIYLKCDLVKFNKFPVLVQNFFHHIEILHISTNFDPTYLNAKRWEHLIKYYMPKLRIFDMQCYGRFEGNLICRDIVDEFKSSFWHEKNWNFSHLHIWFEHLNNGFFYSTKPYRRNEFILYEEVNQKICSQLEENFNSVKHVYIANKTRTPNYSHYFPNANTLTIESGVEMALLPKTINCIVPIQKVMKLFIKEFAINILELVRILDAACNLNIVEVNSLNVDDIETKTFMTTQVEPARS